MEKKISAAKSIEDKTLISINDNSQVVLLKGIDDGFPKKNIDSLLYEGSWVGDSEVVIGWGLAYDLGISLMDGLNPITFYSPKPGRGQVFSEKDILRSRKALASGIFSLNEDLNSSLIFSDFSFAKSLFGIGENMVSSIEIYNTGIGEKDGISHSPESVCIKRFVQVLHQHDYSVPVSYTHLTLPTTPYV